MNKLEKYLNNKLDIKFFRGNIINNILWINIIDLISVQILLVSLIKIYGLFLPLFFIMFKSFATNAILMFNSKYLKYFTLDSILKYIIIFTIFEIIILLIIAFLLYFDPSFIKYFIIIYSFLTILGGFLFNIKNQKEINFMESIGIKYFDYNASFKSLSGIILVICGSFSLGLTLILDEKIIFIIGILLHSIIIFNFSIYRKLLKI